MSARWDAYANLSALLGRDQARIFTQPLVTGPVGPCGCGCALSPQTSQGFAFTDFASEVLRRPLDPWQRWLAIHALELLPNGRPRFRQVLVIVARQNGKTELLVMLSLFWLFVRRVPLILGTSTKLDYARESWAKVARYCDPNSRTALPDLVTLMPKGSAGIRRANGEQEIVTAEGARYKIAASNEEGGRSLTVHALIEDELRQHHDWSAHSAAEDAMQAVPDGQAWAITNQGDDRSVVLNSMRADAVKFIESGDGDRRLGLFEWSAPEGMAITDPDAWAMANPNLGRRIDPEALIGKALRAEENGGEQEAMFRTEVLCQRVVSTDALPITVDDWLSCVDVASTIAGGKVWAIDVTPDGRKASIGVAGHRGDGTPHAELVDARHGTDWVIGRVVELAQRHATRNIKMNDESRPAIVLDPAGPAGGLLQPLRAAGVDPVLMTVRDMGQACAWLQNAVHSRSVRHLGQEQVTTALAGAAPRTIGDGAWAWGRVRSNRAQVDISPLVVITEALWGLTVAEAQPEQAFFASWR